MSDSTFESTPLGMYLARNRGNPTADATAEVYQRMVAAIQLARTLIPNANDPKVLTPSHLIDLARFIYDVEMETTRDTATPEASNGAAVSP